MGTSDEQGRFGPPPVAARVLTITWTPQAQWQLVENVRREGQTWEKALLLVDLDAYNLIEAVASLAYKPD